MIKSRQQVLGTVLVLMFSFVCFDLYCIAISYGVETDGFFRSELVDVFSGSLGLHYNNAATIIMIGLPIAFGFSLQYGQKYMVFVLLMLTALFLSSSRGALLGGVSACMFVAYMSVGGKFKSIIRIFGLAVGMVVISNGLLSFLSNGESGLTMNQLSSGRIELMWLPLLGELFTDSFKLIFGLGMFGMIQLDSYVSVHDFYQATHAHNAYLNLLVDGGLIFLGLLIFSLTVLFTKAMKIGADLSSPLYFGLLASTVGYLITGIFGRQFFPNLDSMMLFPVLALILAYNRVFKLGRTM